MGTSYNHERVSSMCGWGRLPLVILLVMVMPCAARAQLTSLGNFNPPPTNFSMSFVGEDGEQHEVTKEQEQLLLSFLGGSKDGELAVCEKLLNGPPLPWELYRWVFLKRVPLYAYMSREDLAIEVATEWLLVYPEDPINLGLQCVLMQFCAWRESPSYTPTIPELEALSREVFDASKYSPLNVDVVDARPVYATALERLHKTSERKIQALEQARGELMEARTALEQCRQDPTLIEDPRMTEAYLERTLRGLGVELGSLDRWIAKVQAAPTKEEAVLEGVAEGVWDELTNGE